MTKITVYDDSAAKLEAIAEENDESVAEVLEDIIYTFIETIGRKEF